MKKYGKYKDSGIPWIGDIPEHWEVKRLKYIADANPSNIDKKDKPEEEKIKLCNYVDVYKNDYIDKNLNFMEATATKAQVEKFRLKKGNVLITKDSETPEDIANPAYVNEDMNDVVCGYHLTHIKPLKIYGEYLFRQFQCRFLQAYFEISANGITRYGLSIDRINNALILVPPIEEQTAIANYLDRKTAQIEELIAKKERLLELYEEEKNAIINQAVTRGINPNVKLKDSGIPWLGKIPAHWEVKKLKYVVSKIGSGVTPKGGANVYELSGIPLLRSQNIHFEGLKLEDVAYISEEIHKRMSNSKVKSGDVLLNITGASIGRCCFVEDDLGEANVNQHVCIIRPKSIETRFLYNILRSDIGQKQIALEQTGSGREGLNFEALKNFLIPFVRLEEQQKIVEHIEKETSRINAKIKKTKKLIELLKEYKTALISEVVTGKIKVY